MENVNIEEMKAWAAKYEGAVSNENDAETRAVYALFVRECREQFARIPVKVIFTADDPYMKSADLFKDIEAGAMRVYTKGEKHPLLTEEENAIFRAVHDYFGHYQARGNFQPAGELAAWRAHSLMFTAQARRALNTETIAQVAVYFFGSKPKTFATQKAVLL
jgi:hypothetical protein